MLAKLALIYKILSFEKETNVSSYNQKPNRQYHNATGQSK